jgi:diamine N-acetyltransferase
MRIELVPVNRDNWREVIALTVKSGQESFLHTNVYTLAETYVKPHGVHLLYEPLAILADGTLVGLTLLVWNPAEPAVQWLGRFMISGDRQGYGYGKAALDVILSRLRGNGAQEINLTVDEKNDIARRLYENFGFCDTGRTIGGQLLYQFDCTV